MSNIDQKEKVLSVLKWTIRGLGLMFIIPMIVQVYREGLPDFFALTTVQRVGYMGLFMLWAAVFVGFFFELIGGLLILIGMSMIIYSEGTLEVGGVFFIFLMIGLGYIYIWFKQKKIQTHTKSPKK